MLTWVQRFVRYVLKVLKQDYRFHYHLNHIQLRLDQHLKVQMNRNFNGEILLPIVVMMGCCSSGVKPKNKA